MIPLSLALSLSAHAATGPHAVGWRDLSFDDPVAGTVEVRVVYPATVEGEESAPDAVSGPYPLAVFMHGWLGQAWMYMEVTSELASWGFVVVSLNTETGPDLDMAAYADDAVAALHYIDAASDDPADPLAGTVSDADWTALGHSMGGATLGRLLGMESRVRTAVAFMPYLGYTLDYDGLEGWDGSYLVLSGSNDTTAPPDMQQDWIASAENTHRSLLLEIKDMGHQAVLDLSFDEDPMPDDDQRALVLQLATDFVRAEHVGEEDRWSGLLPDAPEYKVKAAISRSHAPAFWVSTDGATLGVAGRDDDAGELFFGTAEADDGLEGQVSGGAFTLVDGLATLDLTPPDGWSGPLYARARIGDGWTRAILLDPGASAGADPEEPGGCDSAGGAGVGWLAALGLLLARRDKRRA